MTKYSRRVPLITRWTTGTLLLLYVECCVPSVSGLSAAAAAAAVL